MKKTKRHTMYGKKIKKGILLGVISCMVFVNLTGCGFLFENRQSNDETSSDKQKASSYREEQLSREMKSEHEHAEELITTLIAALEEKDVEAVKEMFSAYALEHAENLDEKIEELIEFYPGRNGGYEVNIASHETSNFGEIEYVIYPTYKITNNDDIYEMNITAYIENDVDADKLGVHNIQVMTEEAEPEGFKWRNEEDEAGVYVLE